MVREGLTVKVTLRQGAKQVREQVMRVSQGKQSRQNEQQTLDPETEVCLLGNRISQARVGCPGRQQETLSER